MSSHTTVVAPTAWASCVTAVAGESHGQPAHADIVLPPLSTLILIRDEAPTV